MAQSRKPRLHHYFPQFHLAYFSQADSRIWAHDKRGQLKPNPKLIPPASLAAEAHLYDDNAPDSGLEGVEEWLANAVDGPASKVIRKIVEKQQITAVEREDLARYVIARDLRTPVTRDFILGDAQNRIEADYDERMNDAKSIRAAIMADSGVDISEADITRLSKLYRPIVSKGFWLEFMQTHSTKALPRLLAKGWTLFHADSDCEFVTSDLGILKHLGAWDRPASNMPGWWNNADGWLMPLTPKLILAMAPGQKPQEKLAQRAYVDVFNRSVAKKAERFVFARSEFELRRALEVSEQMENTV
jgi:hypothetical protein